MDTKKLEDLEKSSIAALKKFEMTGQQKLEEVKKLNDILIKSKSLSIEARKAGNELFTKKGHNSDIHKDILSYYTKSIAFAPINTEELALGYGNRSALLMHLHHYKESLIDIDKALELTKDDILKNKLQDRRQRCLLLIDKENDSARHSIVDDNDDLENLASKLMSFKPSATLPCASDCVGLAYNKNFGRHLIATKDINPGEILIVEEGYVCYPERALIYLVCSNCLQIAWNGIPCDDCVFVVYCSEACKNQAFEEYHNIECPMIKYMDYSVPEIFDHMATIRILVKAVTNEGLDSVMNQVYMKEENKVKHDLESLLSDGILCADKFKSYYNLISHPKNIDNDEFTPVRIMMLYLLIYHTNFLQFGPENYENTTAINKLEVQSIMNDVIFEISSIINMNSYGYQAPIDCECKVFRFCKRRCTNERGGFLSLTCSLLNHSCVPNVSCINVPKGKIIIFATRPIKKGEQLFTNYGAQAESTADFEKRQNILKTYNFTCKCMACTDGFKVTKESVLDACRINITNVQREYYQYFKKNLSATYLCDIKEKITYSKEYFEEVKIVSKLFHKHLDPVSALVYDSKFTYYFTSLFLKLYGEQCVIPNDC